MYEMGIDPTLVKTSTDGPAFILGTLGANAGGSTMYTAPMGTTGSTAGANSGPCIYMYCKTSAGVTSGHVVLVDEVFDCVSATATNGATGTGAGKVIGVAKGTTAANGFCWVQVFGRTTCLVVAATAVKTVVSLSGTAGALDDLAAVGSIPVEGIYLSAVNSTTGTIFMNWPTMGPAITA